MNPETTMQPPRARLHELKSSANFPSEEFNHSIKTWVNMASLLVKQIIPHQALYPTMMNDIACIDLRQKILGIISRMTHLERRLLKRFQQEHEERGSLTTNNSNISSISTKSSSTLSPPSSKRGESTVYQAYRKEGQDMGPPLLPQLSFRQSEDDEEDEDIQEEEEFNFADHVEMTYEVSNNTLVPDIDTRVLVSHNDHLERNSSDRKDNRRRTMTCGVQNASYHFQRRVEFSDAICDIGPSSLQRGTRPMTLRKKISNEEGRSLHSPECQPNYSGTLPSALFARQREDGHVRRCSSTDAVRASIHFPTAYPTFHESIVPTVPPRSDKRSSMWAGSGASHAAKDYKRSSSRSNDDSQRGNKKTGVNISPSYQAVASSSTVSFSSGEEREETEKNVYAQDVLKSRFSNRRTMSFESSNVDGLSAIPKVIQSQLRKSNSISKLHMPYKNKREHLVAPTPRVSVENSDNTDEPPKAFSLLLNTSMSLSTTSLNMSSTSSVSSGSSTPSASPQLRTHSPPIQNNTFATGYGHSESTASLGKGSAPATDDPSDSCAQSTSTLRSPPSSSTDSRASSAVTSSQTQHKHASSISFTTTASNTALGAPSNRSSAPETPLLCSTLSSPTLASISTWSTTSSGKTAGLLRKIRSRPKMKDQVFEIVTPPSPVPSPSISQQQLAVV